jgi:uncharacterized membrane protein
MHVHQPGLVSLSVGVLSTLAGVALAIPAFWREGDRQYALIAAAVLAMLLVSFVVAGRS